MNIRTCNSISKQFTFPVPIIYYTYNYIIPRKLFPVLIVLIILINLDKGPNLRQYKLFIWSKDLTVLTTEQ